MKFRSLLVVLTAWLILAVGQEGAQADKSKPEDKPADKTKPADKDKPADKTKPADKDKPEKPKAKPFRQETTTEIERSFKVGKDEAKKSTTKTRLLAELTPEEGKPSFKYKILEVSITTNVGGKEMKFDSEKPDDSPVGAAIKVLKGAELALTVQKDGSVEVKGLDELADKAADKFPAASRKWIKQVLAHKSLINGGFGLPPDSGKPWESKSSIDLGDFGKFTVTTSMSKDGKDKANDKLDKIKVERTVKYHAAKSPASKSFLIKAHDTKAWKSTGEIIYDPATKWISSAWFETAIADGKLTVVLPGDDAAEGTEVVFSISEKSKTKVIPSDK